MKTLTLEVIKKPKLNQRTLQDVMGKAKEILYAYTGPQPFGLPPDDPSITVIAAQIKNDCDRATANRRKGMMNTSAFRVKVQENECRVYIVNNVHEDDLFLIFRITCN